MRRLVLTTLLLLTAAGVALAESPHFVSASATCDSAMNLVVSFKEAGLGNVTSANITVSADATAVYQCFNGGGNHPKAGNKTTVNGPVGASGTFPVRNGQTTGKLTASPPGPGGFSCPPGQTLRLVSVTYSNITISGQGATANLGTVTCP